MRPLALLVTLVLLSYCFAMTDARAAHRVAKYSKSPPKGRRLAIASKNPTDAFCRAFNHQCYKAALHGNGTDHVQVIHACHRIGKKYSTSYSFGCKINGKEKTQQVLNLVSDGKKVDVTQASTIVETATVTNTATSTSSTRVLTTDEGTTDVFSTNTATTLGIDSATVTKSYTETTYIAVTATSTSTTTATTVVPLTATETASTTQVLLGTQAVPVLQVNVAPPASRKRRHLVKKADFCTAFDTGCQQQCARVHSKPRHQICATDARTLSQYSLLCLCKDGHVETQHALAAAAKEQHFSTVTTLSTSTTYVTVTSTTVLPTTIQSTFLTTMTSVIPVTTTYTSLSTATQTTATTGTSSVTTTVATETPIITTTTSTSATVATTTGTSTTQLVLPTQGAVQVLKDTDSSTLGYLSLRYSQQYGSNYYYYTTDQSAANTFIAIYDPTTQLYQLKVADDDTGNVFIVEASGGVNFAGDQESWAWTYAGLPGECGVAGQSGAPANGAGKNGAPCETFVFGPTADSQTLQSASDGGGSSTTLILESQWVNPDSSIGQYYWDIDGDVTTLFSCANYQSFQADYYNTRTPGVVTLRFPVVF